MTTNEDTTIDSDCAKIEKMKRKNYKLIFSLGEVFTIQFEDNSFGVVILIDAIPEEGTLYYYFAEIILRTKYAKPTMEDVLKSKVHARIGLGFDTVKTLKHETLLTIAEKFEKIGVVKIKEDSRKLGTYGGWEDTFEDFCRNWNWNGGRRKKKVRALQDFLLQG